MIQTRLIVGDCRTVLPTLNEHSIQCVVTSPPYWGLRDYGHGDQIGIEPTPDAYVQTLVAVFREVRRVLKDDGTVWLNLGDNYATTPKGNPGALSSGLTNNGRATAEANRHRGQRSTIVGDLKMKDLVGIPWRVAFALQQPYYAGTIKDERDRIWLAAMLDAEGCLFIHKRKAGQHNGQGYYRQNDNYGPGVEVCNTSQVVVERIKAIVGKGSISTSERGHYGRKQTLYRWNLRTTESREFVRELYPHLVAKQQQARILCGCPSSGPKAEAAHAALIGLHNGIETGVDFPAPASCFEPGWFLRQDIIWAKNNPMPESVQDRCTKAHEYVFLLTKRERYYWDAEAMREPVSVDMARRAALGHTRGANGKVDASRGDATTLRGEHAKAIRTDGRNRRSVWTIPTQSYTGAHFAVMPEKLVEPCILAGTRPDDCVLDPFAGTGTVMRVATRLGRASIGIDLNPRYLEMQLGRVEIMPLFQEVATEVSGNDGPGVSET